MSINVFICGLGLIGGSLIKAMQNSSDQFRVTAYDANPLAVEKGKELGIVHEKGSSIEDGAKDADIIILASPVGAILEAIDRLSHVSLKPNVIITDVGSTKTQIAERAKARLSHVAFIGGHPMAGSHKSGVEAATPDLFENAYYFLTPLDHVPAERLEQLKAWLSATRAKLLVVDPEKHDEMVGVISHFPHIVAAALVHHLRNRPEDGFDLPSFAAGGFRDITRIASSDPILWQDITLNNREVLLSLFESWEEVMNQVKMDLLNEDNQGIKSFFEVAKAFRDQFPVKKKGAIPSSNDLYLDIADHPGELGRVATLVGEAGLNLMNLNIIELRETISGVLHLSFQTERDRDLAIPLLESNGYHTYLND
ncbi:prephenate dehydrogenase [Pullulanibacillus sp. KACC 23026]|uniref:prephenate dehydrogenase n=1 Tax=Pullulanibacillus sp. KACC 23026 TaxID=3028315 RepID=UPI0023AF3B6B|nr:prephenate dehydrogenase [Pullulanibacillus sp. KACC 23026]WEG11363.1 prephenate dehydrogenase [Pullulanibacillus sp. KACC 23026]